MLINERRHISQIQRQELAAQPVQILSDAVTEAARITTVSRRSLERPLQRVSADFKTRK